MQEIALSYEYMIRYLKKVNRIEIPAADANLYRGLESKYAISTQTNNENNLSNYMFALGKVNSNIEDALHQFKLEKNDNLSEDDTTELDEIDNLLCHEPSMKKTNEAIGRIIILVKKYGIII